VSNLLHGGLVHASNPRTRKRKPLRDVQPPRKHVHQDATLVLGDYSEPSDFKPRYELLKKTIRTVILRGGLESLWLTDPESGRRNPSALLNGLIEDATLSGLHLLRRPQITQRELPLIELFEGDDYGQVKDEALGLTLPAFSDAELVREAKCIADGIVKQQKIIKRPYKRNEDGTPVLNDRGKPVKGYKCVGLRIEHPVQNRDKDDNLVNEWTDPTAGFVSGLDGRPVNGGRTTDYAQVATNQQVAEFQRQLLHEVLAKHLGQDDSEFLLDYLNGRFPESPETTEMAELLMLKLAPYRKELEQFRDLLT
jgi:hypothetical protein